MWSTWPQAEKREVGLMAVGALAGVPLGTWILSSGNPLTLRWAISVMVAMMLSLLATGWRYSGKPHGSLTIGVGGLSGLFSGVAQIGGPPVVAYWLGGSRNASVMRASTILYFAISSAMTLVSYYYGALLTRDVLHISAVILPFFGCGLYIGSKLFGRANEQLFRRLCFGLIGFALLIGLPLWG